LQPVQIIAAIPGTGSATVYWQTPPEFAVVVSGHESRRITAAGATFDRLVNQVVPPVIRLVRTGRIAGNVKFHYAIFT